jgi:hypothetical protein
MTVRLLQPYGKYPKNANLTTATATEDMLLRTGQADTNTAAGTTYVDPVPTERSGPPAVESTGGVDVLRADGRELLNLSAAQALVSGAGFSYVRWCVPGKDTSGTVFKDVSGRGYDATIEASNTTPFATDNRISTVAHASAGGVGVPLAATLCDLATDSFVMAFALTNEDPAASEIIASFGAGPSGINSPGLYVSHRSSAAGVVRVVFNKGNGTVVSGSDTTVKISNAGGTRETHVLVAYDAPTKSAYVYRDGVVAVVDAALMSGANAFTSTVINLAARLGGVGGVQGTVAGIYRGWQGYVFTGKGLPLNIGRVAAILAESPSIPLSDSSFTFA